MVPSGPPTEPRSSRSATLLVADDVVIDGGNTELSRRRRRRAAAGSPKGIHYIDAGTSGGIWGLQEGYCLMVGGDTEVCRRLEPIFLTLAPADGYLRVGDTAPATT